MRNRNRAFFNQISSTPRYNLREIIIDKLDRLGLISARQSIENFSDKLLNVTAESIDVTLLEHNLLKLILTRLETLEHHPAYLAVVQFMRRKSMEFACESAIKLALYCDEKKIEKIYQDITVAKGILADALDNVLEDEIESVLGYILSLNLNKYSYAEMAWYSLTHQINLLDKINNHPSCFIQFIKSNHRATQSAEDSLLRRKILFESGLLQSHLQRDPEEVQTYESRMISAQDDKARLLNDLHQRTHQNIVLMDVGPAGGAIFKSALEVAYQNLPEMNMTYCGIELDRNELVHLNHMLGNLKYQDLTAQQLLKYATFIQGDALNLYDVISQLDSTLKTSDAYLSIVLCSVIHEIYSYCHYKAEQTHCVDITTMTQVIDDQYNLEAVYKVYYEGLKALSENPGAGALNIRDGVMYQFPEELVTFSIQDPSWLMMLKQFLNDRKYVHLKDQIIIDDLEIGKTIILPAKYVQEFMLKANWGPRPFGNEMNEVYCYMTRADHEKLLRRAAEALQLDIEIHSEEYIQTGYQQHITEDKIKIISGFGDNKFPPTNMVIRVKPCLRVSRNIHMN
ncbi:MAG: hypothetical protein SFW66_07030 [Gammaproteobacteria bacterium]|nr:hypothetical protein [Gammaproteobacteria bacterium]